MSLWHLLVMMNAVMPMTGAVSEVHELQSGWMGYWLAIVTGIVMAAISVWVLLRLGKFGRSALEPMAADETRTPWQLRLAYGTAFVLPFISLPGSGWLTRAVLKAL